MLTLLFFVISIVFIVVASTRFKIHPFLSLILGALLFGLCTGMSPQSILDAITAGFGGTIGSIGIIIVAGIIIGAFLENSGGAQALADFVLKLVGKKKVHTAMGFMGWVVSIPVFADSGFIILSSLNRALTKKAKLSLAGTAVALSLGLIATHTMVPPTPGPVAAAGILEADLGLVILLGVIVSLFGLVVAIFYSKWAGKKVYIDPSLNEPTEPQTTEPDYKPGVLLSFLPIIIPIVLIVLRSVAEFPTNPLGQGQLKSIVSFIGNPIIALFIGIFIALFLPKKFDKEMLSTTGWVGEALKSAATIILITGAGGAFGKVLQSSDIATILGENLMATSLGIWFPFIVSMVIKTAQGSSTVAMITAASIVAPLMGSLGFDAELSRAFVVIAIAAGAAVFSHANDSFFWVVTQMSGMNINQGYRTHSLGSAILGVASMIFLYILSLIFI